MSLYLCVFSDGREAAGLEVGRYADFNALRDYVTRELEAGNPGSRFPTLMRHSDCDGEWPVAECAVLAAELEALFEEMRTLPAVPFASGWQSSLARALGLRPANAWESFIDVDGECLLRRLAELAETALALNEPILFQ